MQRTTRERAAPLLLAAVLAGAPLGAQEPEVARYRVPMIALVQPPSDGSVPHDKPLVVFRFTPGEPSDPIDVRSFAVTVDGEDRAPLFQVTASEAWGFLAPPSLTPTEAVLGLGLHQVAARICSARGACGFTATSVTVVPSALTPQQTRCDSASVAADSSGASAPSRSRRIVEALMAALQKILTP